MKKSNFNETLIFILKQDDRYPESAYHFVRAGLDFTVKGAVKAEPGKVRHVTGRELLEGLRKHALQEFGPLARTVLREWNIMNCRDFGRIVFNLVSSGLLGKTEEDKIEDFDDGYDFDEAFLAPFRPGARRAGRRIATQERA